jgi:hypothetical protein
MAIANGNTYYRHLHPLKKAKIHHQKGQMAITREAMVDPAGGGGTTEAVW